MTKIITALKLGGEYNESHVEWLQRQIKEPIYCLTDSTKQMQNVTTIPMIHAYPGWWCKLELFRGDIGTFFYLDLDTVVLQPIPEEWRKLDKTTVLRDVGWQARKYVNSGLMYVLEKDHERIWKDFYKHSKFIMKQFEQEGDQGYINQWLNPQSWKDTKYWQDKYPGQVISYKTDYLKHKNKPKPDIEKVKIMLFHGQPRPWNVEETWVPKLT